MSSSDPTNLNRSHLPKVPMMWRGCDFVGGGGGQRGFSHLLRSEGKGWCEPYSSLDNCGLRDLFELHYNAHSQEVF